MAEFSYLDFDLHIEKVSDRYRVRVIQSPFGQAEAIFDLPFSKLELENFYLRIGRPRRGNRRINSPEMETVLSYGTRLFDTVFSGNVGTNFNSSLLIANNVGKGLRLRLRIASPELLDLPWEYLYSRSANRFLALSTETPIVRYLELSQPVSAVPISLPLRILVFIANPHDSGYLLDVEQEWKRLNAGLDSLVKRGMVQLDRAQPPTLLSLQRMLRQKEYHIFHFIGHGQFDTSLQDGVLLFEDDYGRGRPQNGSQLGTLLHDHKTLRLVVLNACEGARTSLEDPFAGVAQSLVQQGIPAVIGMQFEITDEAAITLAQEFYAALADGYPVDAALAESRKAIYAQDNYIEWGNPVYFTRTPEGHLFDFEKVQSSFVTPELKDTVITDVPSSALLPPKPRDDLSGLSIGRYQLEERIGKGVMTDTYKAFDISFQRQVAIKFLRQDILSPAMLEESYSLFDQEIQTLAKLEHPNIVSIYDYGKFQGIPFLVMQYLEHGSLKIRYDQPVPYRNAARLLLPIVQALAYAHQQGILHLDITPSNLLESRTGELKLADLGYKRIFRDLYGKTLTTQGVILGTPDYMAPEIIRGGQLDNRTDVYALGVVFYELVTGHKLFEANTPMDIIMKHITEPAPKPSDLIPNLPEGVDRVILKALAKSPSDRYENMVIFAVDLEMLAVGGVVLTEVQRAEEAKASQPRKLEAGMPASCHAGKRTELRVMVSQHDSEGLRSLLPANALRPDRLTQLDVASEGVSLEFPRSSTGTLEPCLVYIHIEAPDYDIEKPTQILSVPPDRDSGVASFLLTARSRQATSRVIVNLYKDERQRILLASLSLIGEITTQTEEMAADVWRFVSQPFRSSIRSSMTIRPSMKISADVGGQAAIRPKPTALENKAASAVKPADLSAKPVKQQPLWKFGGLASIIILFLAIFLSGGYYYISNSQNSQATSLAMAVGQITAAAGETQAVATALATGDEDKDGLSLSQELELGTNPKNLDTDGDGLLDGLEINLGLNPLNPDTDDDGIADNLETNPISKPTTTEVVTSSPTPEVTPIVTQTPFPNLAQGCISAYIWSPFEGDALSADALNCWNLVDWGFTAIDGGLLVTETASDGDKSHGIYNELGNNPSISFRIRLENFNTLLDLEPKLMFGVIPIAPLEPNKGKYLLLQRETSEESDIFVKLRDPLRGMDEFLPFRYKIGEIHKVTFIIDSTYMTIYLDGEKVTNPISLPFSERAFWIGYEIPNQTSIQAFLFDLVIE